MTTFSLALLLILYSKLYNFLLGILKVKSTYKSAFIYAVAGISATSIALFFSERQSTTGEIIVYWMCVIGAIVRIGYAHFISQKKALQ